VYKDIFLLYVTMDNVVIEYVWIGGNGELRSKSRVLYNVENIDNNDTSLNWSYDGSSTNQVIEGADITEVYLAPRKCVINPLRKICGFTSYLLLCDTYDVDGSPLPTNNRHNANEIFERDCNEEHKPWFGLEQEYFMSKHDWPVIREQGDFYCGASLSSLQRTIVEEHLVVCLEAGLKISGINAEVAPYQWEFQVGPCLGIEAGDHMCIARYLLQRVAEKYDVKISFEPKPFADLNGSGCHTNFSTKKMREDGGLDEIYRCIPLLKNNHSQHIQVYGDGNEKRLTGKHETASYELFSSGIGTRNTSLRIPVQVVKDGRGYFEDRRPASNMDPYLVTSKVYETCCFNDLKTTGL